MVFEMLTKWLASFYWLPQPKNLGGYTVEFLAVLSSPAVVAGIVSLAIVVVTDTEKHAFRPDGEEIPLDQFVRETPGLEQVLEDL